MAAYVSTVPKARNGFWQILRSEWTKFWTAPAKWVLLVGTVLFGAGFPLGGLGAERDPAGGGSGARSFHLVHQPLSGDGSVVARVLDHGPANGAAAGVVIKASTERMAPFVALIVTPDRGVWLRSFRLEIAGSKDNGRGRWLKLTRAGDAVTGYESADGVTWAEVGTIRLRGLPRQVEGGLVVDGGEATLGTARFDNASVTGPAGPGTGPWRLSDVGAPDQDGRFTEEAGVITMIGTGAFGSLVPPGHGRSLSEYLVLNAVPSALIIVLVLGVLTGTSEYSRRMIRTTFAASPRRGRVLAAKAIVLGSVVLVFELAILALIVGFTAMVPERMDIAPFSPLDPPMLRNVYGPALVLTAFALLGLGAGTIAKRAVGAFILVAALVIGPVILAAALPDRPAEQVLVVTPLFSAFLYIITNDEYVTVPPPTPAEVAQITGRPEVERTLFGFDYPTGTASFVVLCIWIVLVLGVAYWRLRRRDP